MIKKQLIAICNYFKTTDAILIDRNIELDWSKYLVNGNKIVYIKNGDKGFLIKSKVIQLMRSDIISKGSIVLLCNSNKRGSHIIFCCDINIEISGEEIQININDKDELIADFKGFSWKKKEISNLETDTISLAAERYDYLISNKEKKINISDFKFKDFFDFYKEKHPKGCEYCKITEPDINELFDKELIYNAHSKKINKGHKLEYDRKKSNQGENLYSFGKETSATGSFDERFPENNLVLACYWCNQAKMDEYSHEEFKIIGEGFEKVWKKRLGRL